MGRRNPPYWRMALRVYAAYVAAGDERSAPSLPEGDWNHCLSTLRQIAAAQNHGWLSAAKRQRTAVLEELSRLRRRLEDVSIRLQPSEKDSLPEVRFLYDELIAVAREFSDLTCRDGILSVSTEPIVLGGIELGPFSIRLNTARIGHDVPYTVVAVELNPAASCSGTTHPHVHDERLCAGEGKPVIAAALKEGRLFDFFTIVDRILHTYSEGAAYVELEDWHALPCHDCDVIVNSEKRFTCQACEETVCNDCLACCESCNEGYCTGCIESCPVCDYRYCESCLRTCGRCRRSVCESCRDGKLCETCTEELQDAHDSEIEEEEAAEKVEPTESPL